VQVIGKSPSIQTVGNTFEHLDRRRTALFDRLAWKTIYQLNERLPADRLDEVHVEPSFSSLRAVFILAIGGDRYNANRVYPRFAFQLPTYFEPVHSRKADVEEHDFRPEFASDVQRCMSSKRIFNYMPLVLQQDGEGLSTIDVVFSD